MEYLTYKEVVVASRKSQNSIHDHARRARLNRKIAHNRWSIRNFFRKLWRK